MLDRKGTRPLPRKRRLLRGCLLTLGVVVLAGIVGIIALVPGQGPPMLAALAPDADIVLHARDAGARWDKIAQSERFARFSEGPAWRALVESPPAREAVEALEKSRESGFDVTWSRAA